MLLILAQRNVARPALWSVRSPTPWLWRITAAMLLMLAAVTGLPWLRGLMGLALPGTAGMVTVAALLALCLAWLELVRLLGQHLGLVRR